MNDELKDLITGVGALAEVLRMFRDNLLKNGFTRGETLSLTKEYMVQILQNASTNNKEEN